MLEAARDKLAEGIDVVAGIVETHGRAETETLLQGLPVIPRKPQEYKGRIFYEMDLDAILARCPQIVLVDELAHTNIAGSRHKKRYMDVEELLAAGINVYTTLNIQHLETMNDIVTRITGVRVQETIPDRVLESAFQIQLIDIPPEELIGRLKEGKVYVPSQATKALKKFFRPAISMLLGNWLFVIPPSASIIRWNHICVFMVSRSLAHWGKVLVCISASRFSAQLVRAAKRMAESLQGDWFAVHVVSSRSFHTNENEKDSLADNLRLAEKLGAEIISLTGDDVADEILELAQKRNVSQIIIGKPEHSRFWDLIHGSVVDKVIRNSQGISIHVIPGKQQETGQINKQPVSRQRKEFSIIPYTLSIGMLVLMTLIVLPISSFLGLVNISMLYLVPVLLSAARWGRLPAIVTAIMAVITFDFLFVQPVLSFTVVGISYLFSFVIIFMVSIITGTLSARLKEQVNYSRQRENRTSALYALSRDISAEHELDPVLKSIADYVANTLEGQVVILLPDDNTKLVLKAVAGENNFLDSSELAVAAWVYNRGQKPGKERKPWVLLRRSICP